MVSRVDEDKSWVDESEIENTEIFLEQILKTLDEEIIRLDQKIKELEKTKNDNEILFNQQKLDFQWKIKKQKIIYVKLIKQIELIYIKQNQLYLEVLELYKKLEEKYKNLKNKSILELLASIKSLEEEELNIINTFIELEKKIDDEVLAVQEEMWKIKINSLREKYSLPKKRVNL